MAETRAEKAQRLVDEGAVRITTHAALHTIANVISDPHTYYTILFCSGHFYCDCDWGRHHFHTDDLCAHALAVKLAAEKEVGDAEV